MWSMHGEFVLVFISALPKYSWHVFFFYSLVSVLFSMQFHAREVWLYMNGNGRQYTNLTLALVQHKPQPHITSF